MSSMNPHTGTGSSVLVFLRYLAAPVVLYSDNPVTLYDEMRRHIQQANPAAPKLLEKAGAGPLKKVSFFDTEVMGVAIQSDQQGLR